MIEATQTVSTQGHTLRTTDAHCPGKVIRVRSENNACQNFPVDMQGRKWETGKRRNRKSRITRQGKVGSKTLASTCEWGKKMAKWIRIRKGMERTEIVVNCLGKRPKCPSSGDRWKRAFGFAAAHYIDYDRLFLASNGSVQRIGNEKAKPAGKFWTFQADNRITCDSTVSEMWALEIFKS